MTVAITRDELSAADLRREAKRCQDAAAVRRMLALALVLEGSLRGEAAQAAGPRAAEAARRGADGASALPMLDRQTLRDWVHRYNQEGLAGLRDRHRSGRKPCLTPAQAAELAAVVEQGPDPERDRALAAGRPSGAHRASLQRPTARALGREGAAPAWLCPAVGAPEAPFERPSGARRLQKSFALLVSKVVPERAAGKPIEI